jgi:hypothetical protein
MDGAGKGTLVWDGWLRLFHWALAGAVADSGDQAAFMGAFKTLGGTCKGCHDSFRAK